MLCSDELKARSDEPSKDVHDASKRQREQLVMQEKQFVSLNMELAQLITQQQNQLQSLLAFKHSEHQEANHEAQKLSQRM